MKKGRKVKCHMKFYQEVCTSFDITVSQNLTIMVVYSFRVEPNLQCDKNYANFIDISKRMDASHNNESVDLHWRVPIHEPKNVTARKDLKTLSKIMD